MPITNSEGRLDRLETAIEKMLQQNTVVDQRFEASKQRMEELTEKMVQQNILLGQRIDSVFQQMAQQNTALGQRMDSVFQQMTQQNAALNQRIDATLQRIDAQQQHINYLYEQISKNNQRTDQLFPMLEKLPDAVRDQIGFSKAQKGNGEKSQKKPSGKL